jgi:DNA-binding LytR/AlgR family response regulator
MSYVFSEQRVADRWRRSRDFMFRSCDLWHRSLKRTAAASASAPLRSPLPSATPQQSRYRRRNALWPGDGDRLSLLEIEQIAWFESAGNYVRVHSAGRAYIMRTTMDRIAQRLAGRANFIRVRRSAIINVRAVATIERYGKGTHVVHLRNGTKIISSRYYQPALRRLLRAD